MKAGQVRTATLNTEALRTALRTRHVDLPYSQSEDQGSNILVVHGASEQLTHAMTNYLSLPGALDAAVTWRRVDESD